MAEARGFVLLQKVQTACFWQ